MGIITMILYSIYKFLCTYLSYLYQSPLAKLCCSNKHLQKSQWTTTLLHEFHGLIATLLHAALWVWWERKWRMRKSCSGPESFYTEVTHVNPLTFQMVRHEHNRVEQYTCPLGRVSVGRAHLGEAGKRSSRYFEE